MTVSALDPLPDIRPLRLILGDEGLRLFFPLSALHAALWPFLWVVALGFDLPLATTSSPFVWHAHEMLIGSFGAAVIGFITSAVPEWTDTPKAQNGRLFALAAAWGSARIIGFVGADALSPLAGCLDLAWMTALLIYMTRIALRRRTNRLNAFLFWIGLLAGCELLLRYGMAAQDLGLAERAVRLTGLAYLGLLGLALARISVPITNLVLDPGEETSPYRPHPGRINLAPALTALAFAGEAAGLSAPISGFLLLAAGAAFLDRVGEVLVGREILRAELLALAGSALLSGTGLVLIALSRLGLPLSETAGLHLALMGGLGVGVLGVFSIAGLLHTGQSLPLPRAARLALALLAAAVAVRMVPDLGLAWWPVPGSPYTFAATLWALAFLVWLKAYWPLLSDPVTLGDRRC